MIVVDTNVIAYLFIDGDHTYQGVKKDFEMYGPLVKKDGLPEKAMAIFDSLKNDYMCFYEEKDSIGKRYRRQDAIGTPYCITVDHQTTEDNTVTIRERDTMKQDRVEIEKISGIISDRLKSNK